MTKVLYGDCGEKPKKYMNSRKRSKLARAIEHKKSLLEQRMTEQELQGGATAHKAAKATSLTTPRDDFLIKPEPKDDVMFKVVNHAHQRDPKKKW